MKRTILFFLATIAVSSALYAQKQTGDQFLKKFSSGVDVINDVVMDVPDGIKFRTINPGVNVYGLYAYPIGKSNFAFAIGAGLGMHNLHSNGILSDTSGVSFFTKFPEKDANGQKIDYKKNKISLTYLDIPAELRFKSKSGIRFAVGVKVGLLINAHTKFKGDDPADGKSMKIKESSLPNFETWRFGPTMQLGYKWVNLTGFYSVTKVFKANEGPQIYPISIGISLRPY